MKVWLGLGGNLHDSRAALGEALSELRTHVDLVHISGLYRSAPLERADQPDFLNAVVVVEMDLEPRPLLAELKAIERRLGRDPLGHRYGPRLIDLDILAIEGRCIDNEPDLVVPHPKLAERRFALEPLAELDPDVRPWAACPDERREMTLAEALAAVADQDVERIAGPEWAEAAQGDPS